MKGKKETIKNKGKKRGRKIKTQINKKIEREQKQKEAVTKSNFRLQMSRTTNRTET